MSADGGEKCEPLAKWAFRGACPSSFVLAVVVLACNQGTGINSMQYYALKMFQDAGLSNAAANVGFTAFTATMLAMTAVACAFVDRKGRSSC